MCIRDSAQATDKTDAADGGESKPIEAKPETDESAEVLGVTFSDPVTSNYQVGFQALAVKKSATQVLITLPVPAEWPEQSVSVVEETIPTDMGNIRDRELNSGVKQLVVTVPRLRTGTEVKMLMTYQMKTSQINPPPDTTCLLYTSPSPRDKRQSRMPSSA